MKKACRVCAETDVALRTGTPQGCFGKKNLCTKCYRLSDQLPKKGGPCVVCNAKVASGWHEGQTQDKTWKICQWCSPMDPKGKALATLPVSKEGLSPRLLKQRQAWEQAQRRAGALRAADLGPKAPRNAGHTASWASAKHAQKRTAAQVAEHPPAPVGQNQGLVGRMTRSKSHSMLNGLPDSVEAPTRQPTTSSNGKQGVRRSRSTGCLLAMNGSKETPDDVDERQAEEAEQPVNGRAQGLAKEVVRTRPTRKERCLRGAPRQSMSAKRRRLNVERSTADDETAGTPQSSESTHTVRPPQSSMAPQPAEGPRTPSLTLSVPARQESLPQSSAAKRKSAPDQTAKLQKSSSSRQRLTPPHSSAPPQASVPGQQSALARRSMSHGSAAVPVSSTPSQSPEPVPSHPPVQAQPSAQSLTREPASKQQSKGASIVTLEAQLLQYKQTNLKQADQIEAKDKALAELRRQLTHSKPTAEQLGNQHQLKLTAKPVADDVTQRKQHQQALEEKQQEVRVAASKAEKYQQELVTARHAVKWHKQELARVGDTHKQELVRIRNAHKLELVRIRNAHKLELVRMENAHKQELEQKDQEIQKLVKEDEARRTGATAERQDQLEEYSKLKKLKEEMEQQLAAADQAQTEELTQQREDAAQQLKTEQERSAAELAAQLAGSEKKKTTMERRLQRIRQQLKAEQERSAAELAAQLAGSEEKKTTMERRLQWIRRKVTAKNRDSAWVLERLANLSGMNLAPAPALPVQIPGQQ